MYGTCVFGIYIPIFARSNISMAVASGPASPVLAGPVFTVIFGTAHVQIMNNK